MIKKYVLFLAVALTLSGNVNANRSEEFRMFLNEAQFNYPIIRKLRVEPLFKRTTKKLLEENPNMNFKEILNNGIKRNIENYINCIEHTLQVKKGDQDIIINFSQLVEELDPIYKKLNPNWRQTN